MVSPLADWLFQVREESEAKMLPEEQAQIFHRITAQLLFMSIITRRDIKLHVDFITTQVKFLDEDDWVKLKRILKYLKGTKHMKLTLSVDSLSIIKWWVDASNRTHMDCKGRSGYVMSLGKDAIVILSKK